MIHKEKQVRFCTSINSFFKLGQLLLSALLLLGIGPQLQAQEILKTIMLPKKIRETSGLEFFKGKLITHNDSGGKPKLYQFDSLGMAHKTYTIAGVQNTDWEDITADDQHLYIADTGNNMGNRKDLKIFQIKEEKDSLILTGSLTIRYAAQQNFFTRNRHPFDAEALAAAQDRLLLFSKNRSTLTTEVFTLPKTPGDYVLSPEDSILVDGLITAADYNESLQLLMLVGYDFQGRQFICRVDHFDAQNPRLTTLQKYTLPIGRAQVEAIKISDAHHFWITSEAEKKGRPRLFKVKL